MKLAVQLACAFAFCGPVFGLSDLPRYGGVSAWRRHQPVEADELGASQRLSQGVDVQLGGTNEPTIAANPFDSANVVMSSLFAYRVSTTGGVSWNPPIQYPTPAGYSLCGDPSLAYDSEGRLFASYLGCHPSGGLDIFMVRLDPQTGAVITGPKNVSTTGAGGLEHDKQWIAADRFPTSPFRDRLYLAWTEFSAFGTRVLTSFSADQGVTWSVPTARSLGGEGFVWPVHTAVGPDGSVYVSYHSQTSFNGIGEFGGNPTGIAGRVYVLRSTNGALSFPQKSLAFGAGLADVTYNVQSSPGTIPLTRFWLQGSGQAWLLPDPQNPLNVYVVANDDPDNAHGFGDDANVYIARSTNSGLTWSAPIRVDDGPGESFQVMPTAAIDDKTGCIAVSWYDNREGALNSSGRYLLDVYQTISSDGGLTFSPAVRLNDDHFNPDLNPPQRLPGPPPTYRIGEYMGIAIDGGDVHAVWCGNSTLGQQAVTDSLFGVCELLPPPAALGDPTGVASNRYLSFLVPPAGLGVQTRLAVRMASLHHPDPPNQPNSPPPDYSAYEGQTRWVGPAETCVDSVNQATSFRCAELMDSPHEAYWGTELNGQVLYVTGSLVAPSSAYAVSQVNTEGGLASDELQVQTARWGDVTASFQQPSPAPLTQPDVLDISAQVDKLKDIPSANIKPRAQLHPREIDPHIGITVIEVAHAVDGVKGGAYPFPPP